MNYMNTAYGIHPAMRLGFAATAHLPHPVFQLAASDVRRIVPQLDCIANDECPLQLGAAGKFCAE